MSGYGTNEPCVVCGKGSRSNRNSLEPRFGYVTCPKHTKVPPGFIDVAERQFKKAGKTDWDKT